MTKDLLYHEIVSKYQQTTQTNKSFIYINRNSTEKNKKLLVSLSTHNHGNKYSSLESFFNQIGRDLLFITNSGNDYYLENDFGLDYLDLISKVTAQYNPEDICFVGSSMAGYAALRFALLLDANCIVNNPQVDFDITLKHCWSGLRKSIEKMPVRDSLLPLIQTRPQISSAIYLVHGQHDMDIANANALTVALAQKGGAKLITSVVPSPAHDFAINGVSQFLKILEILEDFRSFELKPRYRQ